MNKVSKDTVCRIGIVACLICMFMLVQSVHQIAFGQEKKDGKVEPSKKDLRKLQKLTKREFRSSIRTLNKLITYEQLVASTKETKLEQSFLQVKEDYVRETAHTGLSISARNKLVDTLRPDNQAYLNQQLSKRLDLTSSLTKSMQNCRNDQFKQLSASNGLNIEPMRKMNKLCYYQQQRVTFDQKFLLKDLSAKLRNEMMEDIRQRNLALLKKLSAVDGSQEQLQALNSSAIAVPLQQTAATIIKQQFPNLQMQKDVTKSLPQSTPGLGSDQKSALNDKMQNGINKFNKAEALTHEIPSKQDSLIAFTPNPYIGLPVMKRIKLGSDFQFAQYKGKTPSIINYAVSFTYLLSPKYKPGISLVWRQGVGYGLDNIQLSQEGYGIRISSEYSFHKRIAAFLSCEKEFCKAHAENRPKYEGRENVIIGIGMKKKSNESSALYIGINLVPLWHQSKNNLIIFRIAI